jgi:hypothetical protein
MQTIGTRLTLCVLVASVLFLLGCGGPNASATPVQMVCADTVTKGDVVQAAEYVLTRMHFPIEKLDAGQGIVRTRPLRGAQFFEFWRSDNVGAYDYAEASLQSIRRSVELRVKPEDGGQKTQDGSDARLCAECIVSVQRLRLPGSEVTGVSAAYGIYAGNTPTLQRIEVGQQQRRDMAWIDLGQDRALAARILDRIEKRLEHAD